MYSLKLRFIFAINCEHSKMNKKNCIAYTEEMKLRISTKNRTNTMNKNHEKLRFASFSFISLLMNTFSDILLDFLSLFSSSSSSTPKKTMHGRIRERLTCRDARAHCVQPKAIVANEKKKKMNAIVWVLLSQRAELDFKLKRKRLFGLEIAHKVAQKNYMDLVIFDLQYISNNPHTKNFITKILEVLDERISFIQTNIMFRSRLVLV